VTWVTDVWQTIRSDSHQITIRRTGDSLWIQGSPARAVADGDAVMGEAIGLDLWAGAGAMLGLCERVLCMGRFPERRLWKVSRVDVTENYCLGSLPDVRVALGVLRGTEGGRYRVSQQAGDTVYWSHRSRLRSGKAYAKGPHLQYLLKRKTYTGTAYTADQLEAAKKLLRLELTLGAQWWRERVGCHWWELTPSRLAQEHADYFGRMIGKGIEMDMTNNEREAILAAAPTVRKGRSVCRTWLTIQQVGFESAREIVGRSTWYDHLQVLRAAGLGDADISAGRVVGLRRVVSLTAVSTWEELLAA